MTRPDAIAVPRSLNGARALARNGTGGAGAGMRRVPAGRRRHGARLVNRTDTRAAWRGSNGRGTSRRHQRTSPRAGRTLA